MTAVAYDIHVFGLNLSAVPVQERESLMLSTQEVAGMLEAVAATHPALEAVVVRARNHTEAFLAAPLGHPALRPWILHLRRARPDLLGPERRPLYYHLSGDAARAHIAALAAGHYTPQEFADSVQDGLKAALALAARCGTLGETLDGLFVRALLKAPATPATRPLPVG